MRNRTAAMWMWSDALDLLGRAERLQRQFFHAGSTAANRAVWEPPVDLVESAGGIDLIVALPGVDPDDVRVAYEGGMVLIEALRPLAPMANNGTIHRLEIPYGRFVRRVPLPPGEYERTGEVCRNGCLHIRLRKLT